MNQHSRSNSNSNSNNYVDAGNVRDKDQDPPREEKEQEGKAQEGKKAKKEEDLPVKKEEQQHQKEDLSPYYYNIDIGSVSSEEEFPYYAPPELQMSDQEEGWALNLIQWMEGGDRETGGGNMTPISDFEYALHAIINKGNRPEQAEQKIRALQKFRQTYNIQDTVEEGVKAFQDFIQLHPGHLLHVDTTGSKGSLVAVDISRWFPSLGWESSDNMRVQMVFCYYLFLICVPNFDVLRGGIHFLAEGSGISSENMDVGLENQIVQELCNHLPLEWNQVRLYNNTPLVTSLMDLLKPLMPREIEGVFSVGCQLDNLNYDGTMPNHPQINDPTGSPLLNDILNALCPPPPKLTLPQVFLQPNYNVAMQNLIIKVRTLLEERYGNEETFELFAEILLPPLPP